MSISVNSSPPTLKAANHRTSFRSKFWAIFCALSLICFGLLFPYEPDASVSHHVWTELRETGRANVLVFFHTSSPTEFRRLSLDHRLGLIDTSTERLIQLAGGERTLKQRFNYSRAVLLTLDSNGLKRILRSTDTRAIYPQVSPVYRRTPALQNAPIASNNELIELPDHDLKLNPENPPVKLAILDTGIQSTHPHFDGVEIIEACFCTSTAGPCCGDQATAFGQGTAYDQHGHGTAVIALALDSILSDPASIPSNIEVISVKLFGEDTSVCCVGDLLAALDWLATEHTNLDAVNMSLSVGSRHSGECDNARWHQPALADAVSALRKNGTVVVTASGNDQDSHSMPAPACLSQSISVGATYAKDIISRPNHVIGCMDDKPKKHQPTCFSNSSTILDLLAPGAYLTVADLAGNYKQEFAWGTSFSSPQVAGCAARIRAATPRLAPELVHSALISSPIKTFDARNGNQWPVLDCDAAVALAKSFIVR